MTRQSPHDVSVTLPTDPLQLVTAWNVCRSSMVHTNNGHRDIIWFWFVRGPSLLPKKITHFVEKIFWIFRRCNFFRSLWPPWQVGDVTRPSRVRTALACWAKSKNGIKLWHSTRSVKGIDVTVPRDSGGKPTAQSQESDTRAAKTPSYQIKMSRSFVSRRSECRWHRTEWCDGCFRCAINRMLERMMVVVATDKASCGCCASKQPSRVC